MWGGTANFEANADGNTTAINLDYCLLTRHAKIDRVSFFIASNHFAKIVPFIFHQKSCFFVRNSAVAKCMHCGIVEGSIEFGFWSNAG